jgi:hypothetical protein
MRARSETGKNKEEADRDHPLVLNAPPGLARAIALCNGIGLLILPSFTSAHLEI